MEQKRVVFGVETCWRNRLQARENGGAGFGERSQDRACQGGCVDNHSLQAWDGKICHADGHAQMSLWGISVSESSSFPENPMWLMA